MKKIIGYSVLGIIIFSIFSPLVFAETQNILFYGRSLGGIEDSLMKNYNITKTQQIPHNLSDYNVVALITPERSISPQEVSRLIAYVDAGGALVIIGEDFTEAASMSQLNRLLSSLNITINVDRLHDDVNYVDFNTRVLIQGDRNYLPTTGVSKIVYPSGATLRGTFDSILRSNATSYSKNQDGFEVYSRGQRPPISGYIRHGKGVVVVLGDRSLFENTFVVQEDNALFALNLFDFAAGNNYLIFERVQYKQYYDEDVRDFLPKFEQMKLEGFSDIKPTQTNSINAWINQAKSSYSFGLYRDAYTTISRAIVLFESEMQSLDDAFYKKLDLAKEYEIEARRIGVSVADQAVFNEGVYYLNQAEKETNLLKRTELIDYSLEILEKFGKRDIQKARVEIDTANSKLKDARRTLFYENDVTRAEELLAEAKILYNEGDYSEATLKATESQRYSERAIRKFNIFRVIIGLGLLLVVLLFMILTKRILSWKAEKEK